MTGVAGSIDCTCGESSDNPFQFTGRENDGTGLYYYRARYYSPEMGRFISEDPIGLLGGINMYAYVGNNPLNFVDPFGLTPQGHHYVPREVWQNLDLPDDVKSFLNKATTGKLPGGHGWSKAHKLYNEAVKEEWQAFLKIENLRPSQMTVKDARKFLKLIKESRVKSIKAFLWGLKNARNLRCLVPTGLTCTNSLCSSFAQDPITTLELIRTEE